MRLQHTPVLIDEFRYAPGVNIYFLSHLHEDHTPGLKPTWNFGKIFCSAISRKILLQKFAGIDPNRVVELPVDEPVTVPLLTKDKTAELLPEEVDSETSLVVTLLNANHCPGAVMFLFEGYFGTVLYTGDFRYQPSMITDTVLATKRVDLVCLDNTYCDPRCVFPTREVAAAQVLNIVRDHINTHRVLLAIDSLGKEELLVYLATKLDIKIVVPPRRYELLKLLDFPMHLFTLNASETTLEVIPKHTLSHAKISVLNSTRPTIAIAPSCLSFILNDANTYNHPHTSSPFIFNVLYSLHSSFNELYEFISRLRPRQITPVVPDKFTAFATHFGSLLDKTPIDENDVLKIPLAIQNAMMNTAARGRPSKTSPKQPHLPSKRHRNIDDMFEEPEPVLIEQADPPVQVEAKDHTVINSSAEGNSSKRKMPEDEIQPDVDRGGSIDQAAIEEESIELLTQLHSEAAVQQQHSSSSSSSGHDAFTSLSDLTWKRFVKSRLTSNQSA